jgi:benzoate-CoA ligase family protein
MARDEPYFNLFDYFLGDERIRRIGDRDAIEFRGSRLTYRELRRQVTYWVDILSSRGVAQGDRVALLLYDSPEFIAAFLASASIGAICVPINTFLPPGDVKFIISDSGAKVVIGEAALLEKIAASEATAFENSDEIPVDDSCRPSLESPSHGQEIRVQTTAATPAFLLYTSGSTGTPKGVLHRHGSIPCTADTYSRSILGLTDADRCYSASRLFFAYGLGASLSFPLAAGATVLLDSDRPTPQRIATILSEQRPTVFFGVPAVFRSLLELNSQGTPVDCDSVRLCISAGEALPATVFEDWQSEFGHTILDGIGSTEMLHIFMSNRSGAARPGSSGKTVDGYDARLLDDEGSLLEGEQTGNLWVRGSSAFDGYWNRPDLTQEAIREGWVRTGDIYRRDGAGYFFHVGRSDDCFKVRSLWVSPIEVESALLLHPLVVEAAVVAGLDESGLATARAYVVIRQGGEIGDLEGDLRRHAAALLPQYKVPTRISVIGELPRTVTGKVQRYKLRRQAGEVQS